MRTHKYIRWMALVVVPLVLALAMWPVTQHRRQRLEAQAATHALQAEIRAFYIRHPQTVSILVAKGGNVNVCSRDQEKATVLHCAVSTYNILESDRIVLIRFLIAHGANVNAQTSNGMTPLALAVEASNPEVVRLLIDKGAQVNPPLSTYRNSYDRWRRPVELIDPRLREHRSLLALAEEGLQLLRNEQSGADTSGPPMTPQDAHDIALMIRDTKRIIQMLKSAGARE